MSEQEMLDAQVRQWEAEGQWVDHGRWVRGNWSSTEYHPTQQEIAAKCELFRSVRGWRGANKRAPRGGEFAIATTAGV
jgi:hypothetical protein